MLITNKLFLFLFLYYLACTQILDIAQVLLLDLWTAELTIWLTLVLLIYLQVVYIHQNWFSWFASRVVYYTVFNYPCIEYIIFCVIVSDWVQQNCKYMLKKLHLTLLLIFANFENLLQVCICDTDITHTDLMQVDNKFWNTFGSNNRHNSGISLTDSS